MTARTAYGPSRGVAGERAGAMGADTSYDVRSDRVFVPPASIPSEPRRLRRNHSTLRHPFDPSAHRPAPSLPRARDADLAPFHLDRFADADGAQPGASQGDPRLHHSRDRPGRTPHGAAAAGVVSPAPISRPPKNKISPPTAGAHRRPPVPLFPPTHQALLGQEVVVTLGDASTRTGIVYTVDPVNFSVALLKVGGTHADRRRGCRGRPRLRFDRVFTLKRLLRRRFH